MHQKALCARPSLRRAGGMERASSPQAHCKKSQKCQYLNHPFLQTRYMSTIHRPATAQSPDDQDGQIVTLIPLVLRKKLNEAEKEIQKKNTSVAQLKGEILDVKAELEKMMNELARVSGQEKETLKESIHDKKVHLDFLKEYLEDESGTLKNWLALKKEVLDLAHDMKHNEDNRLWRDVNFMKDKEIEELITINGQIERSNEANRQLTLKINKKKEYLEYYNTMLGRAQAALHTHPLTYDMVIKPDDTYARENQRWQINNSDGVIMFLEGKVEDLKYDIKSLSKDLGWDKEWIKESTTRMTILLRRIEKRTPYRNQARQPAAPVKEMDAMSALADLTEALHLRVRALEARVGGGGKGLVPAGALRKTG